MRNRRTDDEPMRNRLVAVARFDAPDVLNIMQAQPATPPALTRKSRHRSKPVRGSLAGLEPVRVVRSQEDWLQPSMGAPHADSFAAMAGWVQGHPSRRRIGNERSRPEPSAAPDEVGLRAALARYRTDAVPQSVVVLVGLRHGWMLTAEPRPRGCPGMVEWRRCADLASLADAARALLDSVQAWRLPLTRLVVADDLTGSDAARLVASIASAALIAPTTPANHRSTGIRSGQTGKIHANPPRAHQTWPWTRNAAWQCIDRSSQRKTILTRLNAPS